MPKTFTTNTAHITWKTIETPEGPVEVPFSTQHEDVYFHLQGVEESEYVFLESSALKTRWEAMPSSQCFCVGELGFGTGLNFLLTWRLWQEVQEARKQKEDSPLPGQSHLTYVSIEKRPLSKENLQKAYSAWPELVQWSQALAEQYPALEPGPHIVSLAEDVTLILICEDCKEALQNWKEPPEDSLYRTIPRNVHAWYLDGFAPSKNQSMWDEELYRVMSTLSVSETTVATFTSAGHVKRGLKDSGYTVTKKKGFGRKRDMISAIYAGEQTKNK
jgi:tRNA 5-methylaminomethyl-2-thiouridine biosynthesis bifunctional protein